MKAGLRIGFGWALLGVLAALALPASAEAAPRTVASYGFGAGGVSRPSGVAVDPASGDLYVADRNNFRVDRFDPEGHFLLAFGWGVADGTSAEAQACGPAAEPPTIRCFKGLNVGTGPGAVASEALAVAREGGATYLYVADLGKLRVSKFTSSGEFLFMVGKGVDQGGGTPAHPGNICTAEYLADGDVCGAGEAGAGPQEFSAPRSLAIDPGGKLWVGDGDRLQQLGPDGSFASEIELPGDGDTRALAIDSEGDFYLQSTAVSGVRKLHPDGTPYGAPYPLDAAGAPTALALDGEDNVYLGDKTTPYRFMVFSPGGEQASQLGSGQVIGSPEGNALAVDEASGTLYSASSRSAQAESAVQAFDVPEPGPLPENQRAEDVLPTTATLAAQLNPEGHQSTYRFQWGQSESYGNETPPETLAGEGFESEAVQAPLEELIPDTTYHFRLVATNHCNPAEPAEECTVAGPDTSFATRPAIGIEAQWAAEASSTAATLRAELDPLGAQGASWWVQYGEGGALDRETARRALPESFGALTVGVSLTGLAPATEYSYRFVAEGTQGGHPYTVEGPTQSFATQPAGLGLTLPDERAWEMVSPPRKHGGRITAFNSGAVQAAPDGGALAYLSLGSIEAQPEGSRLPEASQVLARRGAGGHWSDRDLSAPHTEVRPVGSAAGIEYKLFSAELSQALLELKTPLAAGVGERAPYLRSTAEPPAYTQLVSTADGEEPEKARVQGASGDLGRVVVKAKQTSLLGEPENSLFEWHAGSLLPLSALPEGEGGATVAAGLGSSASLRGTLSADGTRAFFSTGGESPDGLYVRDTTRGESARLDVVGEGAFGAGGARPVFQAASADGRYAFFTDTQDLTEGASETGADLYRCEVVVVAGKLKCALSDLSAPTVNPAKPNESAEVQGQIPAVSEDGGRAYLVARGVLDSRANAEGESAVSGQPNLYAWSEAGGTRFVATLSAQDAYDWGSSPPGFNTANLSAAASPSGRYLTFMSERSLTGYDNRDARSGEAAQEVFLYDAASDELSCISCNPSGQRPHALRPQSHIGEVGAELSQAFDPLFLWGGREVAALVPEAPSGLGPAAPYLYRPRVIHDDGRVFFNAADSLVPADSNGDGDVYQYEPLGVGSCAASSAGASTATIGPGCVSLISSGTAEGTAAFLDASQGGSDVFFYTPAPLAVTDTDRVTDVYDARIGGEPASLDPRVECLGEACQPPGAAPAAKTPASAAYRGPGNLREAGRGRCAKPARTAQRLSRRARSLRRASRRMAHSPAGRGAARRSARKARRLAHRARRLSKGARRCRQARAKRRSNR